ncbi:hypothetical protein D9611_013272 [Ephemerocybe angulata]|uniref:Uncharacterized protein n=1 Tax=Ephemerocybe angulata TaxID=980116 RepID=A0A8H5FJ52_9AGAR|nr:hypothetical protein D9611_013272 [Tulosesus angulatus]
MSADQDQAPGVIGVATSGIQDVSALLPLLGTEQCERLVTSALERGILYAAATPMSIFGSLGIVKAGFVVLLTSIDGRLFPGPTLMQNSGFTPAGIGKLLARVAGSDRHLYVAEDKLRSILGRKKIRSVKINLLSRDLLRWNFKLIAWTAFLGAFGLTPYIYLIVHFLPSKPFRTTWLYPILRIAGCNLVTVSIQLIFQLRVLEETYCRIRFIAYDNHFKGLGISLPEFWDSNERSKTVLSQFRSWLIQGGFPAAQISRELRLGGRNKQLFLESLGRITSFSLPPFDPVSRDPPRKAAPPAPDPSTGQASLKPDLSEVEKGSAGKQPVASTRLPMSLRSSPLNPELYLTTSLLWIIQAQLLFGLGLAIVGYIGCFSVVQAAPPSNSKGPLVWIALEAVLAIARTLLWALNPTWDDPKSPMALKKYRARVPSATGDRGDRDDTKCSYGIGWTLDSATADDMHALIIGIDVHNTRHVEDLKSCVKDAQSMVNYLEDTLLVPRSQIVTLYNSEATKERIITELEGLVHKGSVSQDAPIIVYIATQGATTIASDEMWLPGRVVRDQYFV